MDGPFKNTIWLTSPKGGMGKTLVGLNNASYEI